MRPENETFQGQHSFPNTINNKRFTRFSRIGMNGTGTARQIVKRGTAAGSVLS